VGSTQNDMDDVEDDIQTNFQKTFGWFLIVNKIADNDFTKHEYIYKKKVIEVLNQLSYLIAYDKEVERINKQAMGTQPR
jgi:hypothetical protein